MRWIWIPYLFVIPTKEESPRVEQQNRETNTSNKCEQHTEIPPSSE
jgi:hypothetical protein